MPEVDIPEDYNTFGTVMGADAGFGGDADQAYDFITRQTIPLILLGSFVDPEGSGTVDTSFYTASVKHVGGKFCEARDTDTALCGVGFVSGTC